MCHHGIVYFWMLLCHASWSILAVDINYVQTKCPGPLAFYTALGCKPVENDAKCAEQYDCGDVKSLPWNKCHVNGANGLNSYDVGERLKDKDANPCDIGCTCSEGIYEVSAFTCAIVDCNTAPLQPGCYRKNNPLYCCPGEEVCPKQPEDRATCTVNGNVYLDGQYFSVESEPDLNCVCQPGYTGKNVEPFCAKPKHPYCSPLFSQAYVIKNNCAPVYYSNQSPQTGCALEYRCQTDRDEVMKSDESTETEDAASVCHFGSLILQLGEELKQDPDFVCVKCVCEVPPTLTCQQTPDEECDNRADANVKCVQDSGASTIKTNKMKLK